MKSAQLHKFVSLFLSFSMILVTVCIPVYATDLNSANYKIIGITTNSGGGLTDSTNYSLMTITGEISANPTTYSSLYRMNLDPSANFVAEIPTLQCFETNTGTGATQCTSAPAEVLSGGMQAVCGQPGCYDRARFEINPMTNPSDTLYSIEISTDNFVSDIKCINASTFAPKADSCNINDFRTESYWENELFNITALTAGTTYYIRVTALHGDFTQSEYSKSLQAATSPASISFDIDIADVNGTTTESSSPYSISFSGSDKLTAGAFAVTAHNLVWLDLDTNAYGGASVIQFGKNGGLYSPTTAYKIASANEDLDVMNAEGFGFQSHYINFTNSSSLTGSITAETNYAGTGNVVGIIGQNAQRIYLADGSIANGRMGIYLKARAGMTASPATDYGEDIFFTVVPLY